MGSLPTSLALGLRQVFDGAVLRILLKSVAVTIVLFLLVATGGWHLLDWLLAVGGLEDALFAGAGAVRGALSFMLAVVGLWLTWRIVAMAVIQFYADEIVLAVERRHYPAEADLARELSVAEQWRNALRGAGRALLANLIAAPLALVLLFTGVGTFALFWLVNAVLLGRELQDMVWLRHCHQPAEQAPVAKAERFLLGGLIAAMMAVPFANFLAPVLGATSATHLVHRKLQNSKAP
ncbi:EI24 domain-containing protein [Aurantiacibacter sp. MUD11]|uniref:EI24 domain-containing protein n=1 Tax=Aurantiacibacter sp. MUD11 TaxID=3003265 RepID=UPI0022AA8E09|nr:EI24 domain-containing protein [Aurantiacibacter sp. MUD11]WAT17139.1 EI24 domain-containing protein [Aurantiacibacter sp. MUD11]